LTSPGACPRWGYYIPFDVGTLNQLYRSHERYVNQVTRVTRENVRHRYILERDAEQTIHQAIESHVGARAHGWNEAPQMRRAHRGAVYTRLP